MKIDIDKLFGTKPPVIRQPVRTYDVRVSLNKAGGKHQCVRFGFINKAAELAGGHGFAEASDIEFLKTRIYFRFPDAKTSKNVHVLSRSTDNPLTKSCYFTITPNDKAEKLFRMNWIGKVYDLQYDEENELYYIENTKEDN